MSLLNKMVGINGDLIIDLMLDGAAMATISIMEEAIPNIKGKAVTYNKETDTYTVKTDYRGFQRKRDFYFYTVEAKYLEEVKEN